MPNYILESCLDSSQTFTVFLDGESLTPGTVLSFSGAETPVYCGVVISETTDEATYDGIKSYETCCDCYTGETLNTFKFTFCSGGTLYTSISGFCQIYGNVPKIGEVFKFYYTASTDTTACATFVDVESNGINVDWMPDEGPFINCGVCETGIYSAGTEYKSCKDCCPCGATGGTVNNVIVPHAIWTNLSGKSVMLLDTVVLGGPNGLNS